MSDSDLEPAADAPTTEGETILGRVEPPPTGQATVAESLPEKFGRYRILRELGRGGMGAVFLAHDTELKRRVALKVPRFDRSESAERVERFYREARAAGHLRHTGICGVYDIGQIDGVRYISMAYIEGRSLSEVLRAGPLAERAAAVVVSKLAVALQAAHDDGVVHRDLKPANVMIDEKGEPIITDFGLARDLSGDDAHLTTEGTLLGSPAYMSPEQVDGDPDRIGPASDVYSLGVLMFECLTGRTPFQGTSAAIVGRIATTDPPAPSEFRRGLAPELESICLKMLARRKEHRYVSAQHAADDLSRYLQHATGSDDVGMTVEFRRPPARRRSVLTCIVFAGVLVVAAAVAIIRRPAGEAGDDDSQAVVSGKSPEASKTKVAVGDAPRGQVDQRLVHPAGAKSLAVSTDGKLVITGGAAGMLTLWELDAGKKIRDLPGHRDAIRSVVLLPDGERAVTASKDQTARLWNLNSGRPLRQFTGHTAMVTAAVYVPRDDLIVTAGFDAGLIVWGADSNTPIKYLGYRPGEPRPKLTRRFDRNAAKGLKGHVTWIRDLSYSPASRLLASCGNDNMVLIWNIETGEIERRILNHAFAVGCVAFSPDGRRGLSGDFQNRLLYWEVGDGRILADLNGHGAAVNAIAFSSDGSRAISADDVGTVILWDLKSMQELTRFEPPATRIDDVQFTPDDRRAVTVGNDGYLRVWRLPD